MTCIKKGLSELALYRSGSSIMEVKSAQLILLFRPFLSFFFLPVLNCSSYVSLTFGKNYLWRTNLHKFFSQCKARHDLSAYTKSKGKTCQQFELLLLPKLIILNQEYPFLYFLKILTGHQEKKKKDRVFVKSGKLYPGCYANFKQWQWYLNFKHISRQALRG